jgi:hypothetical protein
VYLQGEQLHAPERMYCGRFRGLTRTRALFTVSPVALHFKSVQLWFCADNNLDDAVDDRLRANPFGSIGSGGHHGRDKTGGGGGYVFSASPISCPNIFLSHRNKNLRTSYTIELSLVKYNCDTYKLLDGRIVK